jgi:hypothetical protein
MPWASAPGVPALFRRAGAVFALIPAASPVLAPLLGRNDGPVPFPGAVLCRLCAGRRQAWVADRGKTAMPTIDIAAEDEFVYVLEGELTPIEDGSERLLRAGECAAFPKGSGNGHHLINNSDAMAVYLEVGARSPADVTICSDIDMMSSNAAGRFVQRMARPIPRPRLVNSTGRSRPARRACR